MAEKCFPLENTLYNASDAQLWFATRTSGVYAGTHLGVTANGTMDVSLGSGIAWLHYDTFAGCVYANTDPLSLTVDMADAQYNRIDRVCIRIDILSNKCKAYIKKGTAASSPVPPALQRDNVAYEICVAEITVGKGVTSISASKITDKRLDGNACGLMRDGVTGIDTSVLEANFNGWMADTQTEFEAWFADLQTVLEGDVAANLYNEIQKKQDKLTFPLAVALGGTGAYTKEGALAALGTKAVGWKQLWSGSFKSGSITVTDWSKYRVLAFSIDTSITVLGVKVHTGRVYLHTVSHSGTEQYVRDLFVNSDGDTVTFGNSMIMTNKGTSPYHEVGTPPAITAIYGVIEQ